MIFFAITYWGRVDFMKFGHRNTMDGHQVQLHVSLG
ncbi:hypothetical protein SLEP1_g2028 [Rubroshorea leprosula]|uniref:Uncharacterized protein n=1 Tax=Rubroshorea leprosula TaxID=152421 RepID=A0AAV5HQB0_9ROSI|nr:hypothetical protein SLEP1_g2028 [Rubroshorea leprosula]